jgi:surface protein
MSDMFRYLDREDFVAGSLQSFNQDLNDWDVNAVTTFSHMFKSSLDFNGNIGDWDTRFCRSMEEMFRGADNFNQDISSWDVASVTTIERFHRWSSLLSPFGQFGAFTANDGAEYQAGAANMMWGANPQSLCAWELTSVSEQLPQANCECFTADCLS